MHSFTEENYLKVIYHISQTEPGTVQTNAIANGLNTKAASVTDMLKKLSDKQLIDYIKYQGVTLTEKGKAAAIKVIRKHRLWEVFLVDKLKFRWDEVHDIAEELEHINSSILVERLDDFLGFPKRDPHGDPIPDQHGNFEPSAHTHLHEIAKGKSGIIIGVSEHSSPFLIHLEKLGLTIGVAISVLGITAYDGSVELVVNNQNINVSRKVAQHILVKLEEAVNN